MMHAVHVVLEIVGGIAILIICLGIIFGAEVEHDAESGRNDFE